MFQAALDCRQCPLTQVGIHGTQIHDQPVVGNYGTNGDVAAYNGYPLIPPYSRAVNSTNIPYTQQLPITIMGGPTYMYASQNMSSQFHNP